MDDLTPSQKGAIAEAAITAAAIELKLVVLRPLCEGGRYDLAIDLEPRLLRVQCKLAPLHRGAVIIRLQSNRLTPAGYVRTTYSAAEVDAIRAFCLDLRRCFLVPIEEAANRRGLHLRVEAARNSQSQRIRWASAYSFDAMVHRLKESTSSVPPLATELNSSQHTGL